MICWIHLVFVRRIQSKLNVVNLLILIWILVPAQNNFLFFFPRNKKKEEKLTASLIIKWYFFDFMTKASFITRAIQINQMIELLQPFSFFFFFFLNFKHVCLQWTCEIGIFGITCNSCCIRHINCNSSIIILT